MRVLADLQTRGVEDILIASVDNLSGFVDAIGAVFPKTDVQLCVVHQIRNSKKYLAYTDTSVLWGRGPKGKPCSTSRPSTRPRPARRPSTRWAASSRSGVGK